MLVHKQVNLNIQRKWPVAGSTLSYLMMDTQTLLYSSSIVAKSPVMMLILFSWRMTTASIEACRPARRSIFSFWRMKSSSKVKHSPESYRMYSS